MDKEQPTQLEQAIQSMCNLWKETDRFFAEIRKMQIGKNIGDKVVITKRCKFYGHKGVIDSTKKGLYKVKIGGIIREFGIKDFKTL